MPDPVPRPLPEPFDVPRSVRATTSTPSSAAADDATVRRAPAAGTGIGSSGSSARRVDIVVGPPADALAAPAPLPRAGESIDVFELERSIGVGGMGAVFRALDTRLDRHVALKILPPEQAQDVEVVQRFYQEGRAAARLDHENIARVYTIGHDGRVHYIAFEYIEGTTVRQRVEKNGPLPVGEAINFTLQIADALVHAAERGVVHRDIKPSNIIVTPHGRAKLVDMGLARRFERGVDDGLTQSGMTLGTFDYISPEQARDPRDVDVRSDLYSLGCTMFHMLTGRPPFPDGTVLQKLIQHQEEPPPDLRALNAAVPADLNAIVVKLMAKDRDRRYQTPEQLVRDLLTVAGGLGLRSVSPEGLVWLPSEAPPGWERTLVWALPTVVFATIVLGLVWWGQDPGRSSMPEPLTNLTARPATTPPRSSTVVAPAPVRERVAPVVPAPAVVSPAALDLAVEAGDDLLAAIARAPRHAVIRLGNGVHRLAVAGDDRAALRLVNRELTIKAEPGARPVLKPALDRAPGTRGPSVLLEVVGGHVTLEGLEFAPDDHDSPRFGPTAAVRAEDAELTLQRCVFRRPGGAASSRPVATSPYAVALDLIARGPFPQGDRPPAVAVDRCHFDGGQAGVRVAGPVDLIVRDCTLSADEPAVWVDSGVVGASRSSPCTLRLRHVSVLAGAWPVFRIDGPEAHIWLDDSVVSAAAGRKAGVTLVAADHPEGLVWRGRGNLYAGVSTFLQPVEGHGAPVREASRWEESAEGVRESGTTVAAQAIWADADPSQTLAQESENPTRAFRLAPDHPGGLAVGAREGPFGTLALPARVAVSPALAPSPVAPSPAPTVVQGADDSSSLVALRPLPADRQAAETARPVPAQAPVDEPPAEAPAAKPLPEMPVMAPTAVGGREPGEDVDMPPMPARRTENAALAAPPPAPAAAPAPAVARANPPVVPNRSEPPILRMPDQLLNALSEPSARGGVLRVPAGADWELATATIRATGSWRVQAEPGATRPRLRFLPGPVDPQAQSGLSSLFALRSGSLLLDGFDIVLPRDSAPRQGRWSVFSLLPGTDLSLTNCTVTIEGEQISSAVVAVESTGVAAPVAVEAAAVTVRLTDCFVRAGDDFVDVAGGCRLALEVDDTALVVGGSLVHAHGLSRGETPEKLGITLRQVTACAAGGVIRLDSAAGAPELPVADVNARYSILATGSKDVPLIRVDGQDAPATTRDRVVWEGLGVAYHLLPLYRRDQSAQVGAVPTVFNQTSWTVAVGAREKDAFHGDVKFLRPPDPAAPAWSLDKDALRLDADSPARASGADLSRIPDPPPVS